MSDRQQDVRWLRVRALHDRSYITGILLLAHGLTVKLVCPCSHSIGRMAACLCGHPICDLLLAQARPRMIQHLSSLELTVCIRSEHTIKQAYTLTCAMQPC